MIPVAESEQIEAREHLDDLCALEGGLTPWEMGRVEQWSHQKVRPFSRKVIDKIQQIWMTRT